MTRPRTPFRTLTGAALASVALSPLAPWPVAAATGAPTAPPGADLVAPLVQPSVVYETIQWSGYVYDTFNRQYLRDKAFTVTTQCTGFVVNPDGWVATAGHCVDPSGGREAVRDAAAGWALENGYYADPSGLGTTDVTPFYRVDVIGEDGHLQRNRVDRTVGVSWGASVSGIKVEKRKPARVVAFQPFGEGDGALLKVDESDLNAIELAESDEVEINSGVVAVGYPAVIEAFTDPDLTPTFDPGTVSSIKTVARGLLSVFQLSAGLSGGMSGGPTVDDDGNVIGVNSARFVGEPFAYAVPAERIRELMAGAGVENEVSETTQAYRDGIRAYAAGERATAVAALERVLEDQPANGLAEDFLAKARALPAPEPAESDSALLTWVLVGAGASGVVVLVTAGAMLALRRRRAGAQAAPSADEVEAVGVPVPERIAEPVLVGASAATAGPTGAATAPAPTPMPAGFAPSVPLPRGAAEVPPALSRHCDACGEPAPAAGRFCGGCGSPLGG